MATAAHGRRGGRYSFTGGWNTPAVIAWVVGAAFGLLTTREQTQKYPFQAVKGALCVCSPGRLSQQGHVGVAGGGEYLERRAPAGDEFCRGDPAAGQSKSTGRERG